MKNKPVIISWILFLAVFIVGVTSVVANDNFQFLSSIPVANANLTKSIVLQRVLNIDKYKDASGVDVVKFKGHYYSAYPPGYSFFAVPFYGVLQIFNYGWVHLFKPLNGAESRLLESLALALPSILSLALTSVLLFKLLYFYKNKLWVSALAAWALPFTTFLLGYLPTAFFHLPAAFFLFLGFYVLVTSEKITILRSFVIGLSLGLVAITEYVPALCFIPIFLVFIYKYRDYKKSLLVLFGFLVGFSILGAYNYKLFGAPWKFGESYAATSNSEATSFGIAFTGNPITALSGNYLSRIKGVVTNAPLFILAIPGFYFLLKRQRKDGTLALAVVLVVSLVYAFWHDWGGGWSLGPRFYTSLMPFFFTAIGFFVEHFYRNKFAKTLLAIMLAIGVFVAFWSLSLGPRLLTPKAEANIGIVATQRASRLPLILEEGFSKNNLAPFIFEAASDLPIISKINFSTLLAGYSFLTLFVIIGSLLLILKIAKPDKVAPTIL
ncbi:MAG: hypothetical protein NT141_03320 [candidate division WWE3 bacterium]|nr:hypothetical protein [candidate division WWE3 bacterium]